MDTERELRDILHRDVLFESRTYTIRSNRILSLTLRPRHKRALKWVENHRQQLLNIIKLRLCVSQVEIEII